MSTSVLSNNNNKRERGSFPSDKSRAHSHTHTHTHIHTHTHTHTHTQTHHSCRMHTSITVDIQTSCLPALGTVLAACLTCLSQPQFHAELFWDGHTYIHTYIQTEREGEGERERGRERRGREREREMGRLDAVSNDTGVDAYRRQTRRSLRTDSRRTPCSL